MSDDIAALDAFAVQGEDEIGQEEDAIEGEDEANHHDEEDEDNLPPPPPDGEEEDAAAVDESAGLGDGGVVGGDGEREEPSAMTADDDTTGEKRSASNMESADIKLESETMIQADSGASKSTTTTSAVDNAADAATGPAAKNPPKRRRRPIPGPPISIPGVAGAAPAAPNSNHGNMAGVPGMPHPMAFMPYGYFIPPPPPGGGPFFPNGNGGGGAGGASGGSNSSSGPASAGSGNMGMMPYPAWHPMMMMQLQPPPPAQRLLNPEDGCDGRDNEAANAAENAAESTPAASNAATSGRGGAGDGTNSQRAVGAGATPPSFGPYGAAMAGATPMYFPPPYMMAQQQMMMMQQQQQHYAAATAAAMQSRPSSSSQAGSSGGNGGNSGPVAAAALQYIQPGRGIVKCLSLACDVEHLSDYQILVRQQLELFEADERDVECNTQGRKRPVTIHQVGLRCRHCALTPYRHRGRGAVYYPAKLEGVYQAAQNMAGSHLCKPGVCPHLPPLQQQQLKELRSRRDNASGGKQYWADGCRALGLAETPNHGLRFTANTENASLFPSASSSVPTSSSNDPLAGTNNEGTTATGRIDHHTAAHDTTPSNNVESYDVEHDGWVV